MMLSSLIVGLQDDRDLAKLETLVWDPNNPLQEQHIDQFLVIARYHEIPSCLCLHFSLMNFLSLLEMTWLVAQMKDSETPLTGYKYLTGHINRVVILRRSSILNKKVTD